MSSTITNLSNSLRRTYSNRYFRAFQNDFTPILNELDEAPDEPTRGEGWYFPFHESSPQNWKVNLEAGPMGTVRQRTEVQGKVNAAEFLAWMQISELLKNAGTREAAWNGGELNRQMKESTTDVTKGMQRQFVLSPNTGRLGRGTAIISAAATFTADLDEGVNGLMVGDSLEFVDPAGTPGSQIEDTAVITAINRQTRVVTLDAAVTTTVAPDLYREGTFHDTAVASTKIQPNGLLGLIDDGTFSDDIHGQSRAARPKLSSQVRDPGSPTILTEEHMRQLADDIYLEGGEIDRIYANVGVMNAFFDVNTGDRRYAIEKGKTAKFVLGYREGDALFSYDKGTVVLKKDPQVPARTMFFVALKQTMMKNTLRKLGWLDEGGSILRLTPNASGFNTSWTALMVAQLNISCIAPIWNGVRRNISDSSLAGD